MLVPSYGDCDICKGSLSGELLQSTQCTCKKCGEVVQACSDCRNRRCPKCGGKLVSAFDDAAEKGIIF